ncbi:type I-F CRISPR-associated protein Csy3 [Parachitinimonas caeni]|uniref:Type I-F CRISPR-associated protein Csy3 n=1 Tax=Parachitinimonas caeni TaxID=3031301 RepID=A0ABT7E5F1_9NEIS|nr:type I-F CRISPR-associated protein Csy3 [Parachitinimonas caeni]MDK2126593.1 type I-F CRISPR-associated protein Csy3 [Parachitinimonas caeni]
MSTSNETFKKLPGVLSFQRGLIVTDATFYSLVPKDNAKEGTDEVPVRVVRHGIRGTQNTNKFGKAEDSTSSSAKRENPSNIQTTDSAKLDAKATALIVRFELRFLDLANTLFACAPSKDDAEDLMRLYKASVDNFISRAKQSEGLNEVARRLARNIANGRWLWRNRTLARQVQIIVNSPEQPELRFDALTTPLQHFNDYSDNEKKLGELIANSLAGKHPHDLQICAIVDFGVRGAIEVFPSQNYVEDKPKGFARPLYALGQPEKAVIVADSNGIDFQSTRDMGHAALRDQKISNALRTLDTWYPDYAENGRPIPVEPNGASLDAQCFFRNNKKTSAFEYAKQLNVLDPSSPEGQFMIASLIRGGVFSGGNE